VVSAVSLPQDLARLEREQSGA